MFDTKRWVKNFESGLTQVMQRYNNGLQAEHTEVIERDKNLVVSSIVDPVLGVVDKTKPDEMQRDNFRKIAKEKPNSWAAEIAQLLVQNSER